MQRIFAGFLLLSFATSAWATDGVVGPGNCDESGFDSVLAAVDGSGGGTITFDCGLATIPFTSYKMVANAVTIDGADLITFDGGNTSGLFQIFASADVRLERLTLKHGVFNGSHAIENFGTLTLDGVHVSDNSSTESPVVNNGTLNIWSSTFSGNALSNPTGVGGAISQLNGDLNISYSTFSANHGFDGGAIYIDAGSGPVRIAHSIFSANMAGYGGAIETWAADVQIASSFFDGNGAQSGDGGAIWSMAGQLVVNFSEFVDNTAATTGGAISCYGDIMNVINSAFAANEADTNGGGIYSTCAFSTLNVTFNGNTAPNGGGGAIYQSSATDAVVTFATVADNEAIFGGGLYNDGGNTGVMHVGNSIVSENAGGNCDGVLASNGYNLSNDMGCGSAFTGPGDVLNASLPLLGLANYGGPTSTRPPDAGNPAIDHVPNASCGFPADQRGAARPTGPACDSGAVEVGGIIDLIFADGFDAF